MSGFSNATRQIVKLRSGGQCERCGRSLGEYTPRSLHHRRPRGMGGNKSVETNSPANAVAVCGTANSPDGCHGWIESNRQEALELGWLVRQGHDPSSIPIPHVLFGLVLLTHDGGFQSTEPE